MLHNIKLTELEQQVFDPSCSKNPRICVMSYRGKWYGWEGECGEFYSKPPSCTCKYGVKGFSTFESFIANWRPRHKEWEEAKVTLITAAEVRCAVRSELEELDKQLGDLID